MGLGNIFGKQSFLQGLASDKDDGRDRNPKQFSKHNHCQVRDHQGQNYKQSNSGPPKKGRFTKNKFGGTKNKFGGTKNKFGPAVTAEQDRSFGTDLTTASELLPVFSSPVGDQTVQGRLAHYWRNWI